MRTTMAPVVALALALAVLGACGQSEQAKQAEQRAERLRAAEAKLAQISEQQHKLLVELDRIKSLAQNNQSVLDQNMDAAQKVLKSLTDDSDELRKALAPPPGEEKNAAGSKWSWFWPVLLVLVLLIGFIYIFRLLTREDDGSDDVDGEFQEENDLGTVRYPGTQSPATPEPRAAKPSDGPGGGQAN